MPKQFYIWVRLLVVVLLLGFAAETQAAPANLSVNGLMEKISEQKGKVVVVNLFAAWCPPCRQEIPGLINLSNKYKNSVSFIGIAVDDEEGIPELDAYLAKIKIPYPLYYSPFDIPEHFQSDAIPYNVIYNKQGKMFYSDSGLMDERTLTRILDSLVAE